MKIFKILIFFTFFSTYNLAAQYNVTGKIIDKSNGENLSFATIIYNSNHTTSNSMGEFRFTIPTNKLSLKISYIGYFEIIIDTTFNKQLNDIGTIHLKEDVKALDEITITSGKYQKALKDVTVSMETIKPKFLDKNAISNFENLIEKIPGVNFIDGQANIRGGSGFSYGAGSRVMVLYNNLPMLQFDSAIPNWENIPTETIAKVEVLKGAGSALYGSAAMNGIINILPVYAKTKAVLKIKSFSTIFDSPSDPDKKWWKSSPFKVGYSGLYAKKINKLDLVGSFYLQKEDLVKQYGFNNYGRATLNLDYHLTDRLKVGINTNYNRGQGLTFFFWKNSNSGAYQADTVAYSAKDKQLLIIDPNISYTTSGGTKHKFHSRIYHVSNLIGFEKYDLSTSYYGEYQYQKSFNKIGLMVTAGVVRTHSSTNAELYGDTIFVANNSSTYLQLEKTLWNKINLVAGVRYESNSIKGPQIILEKDVSDKYEVERRPVFRFGVNYSLFEETNIRASWGQGFRYPTIAEKFTNATESSLFFLPNIDLKSETGTTAEIGIRQGWKFRGINGFADITAFQSEYNNMIEFVLKIDKSIYFTSENIGNTIIKGIELSSGFSGNIGNVQLDFNGGYYYIDPKYKELTQKVIQYSSVDYNVLKYRSKQTFKFDTDISYKKFSFGFGSSYSSFMEAIDKIFEIDNFFKGIKEYRIENNHGNNIYRMRIGYTYDKIGVQLNVDNLFNKEYSIRPGLLENPRSYTITMSYGIE